jgi:hypothetical protein
VGFSRKLDRFISQVQIQSELEQTLVDTLSRRMRRNIALLDELFGTGAGEECYEGMMACITRGGDKTCLDRFEHCVLHSAVEALRRPLTEREEELVSEVVGQITDVTELLLTLGGVELVDPDDAEEEEGTAR